jgi:hypothetical protein
MRLCWSARRKASTVDKNPSKVRRREDQLATLQIKPDILTLPRCASAELLYLRHTTSAAAGNGLGTTIKYLCGAAGIGLDTTTKYLRRTTRQRPGHHDQGPAMHNARRFGNRFETIPGIDDEPIHYKRPAFVFGMPPSQTSRIALPRPRI